MRDLKLPVRYKALLPLAEGDWAEGAELRKLGGRINSAALAIEDVIVEIVSNTLLREVREKRNLVIGALLKTDACSFSAKRKLLLVCIDNFLLLNKTQRNDLDQHLAKISSYRNAFAHGDLVHNGFNHELHYFQGQPQVAILDDAYFGVLQERFLGAWELIETAQAAAALAGK